MATIFNPINKPIADQIDVRQGIMAGTITNQHARNTYLNKACVVKLVPLVIDTTQDTNYDDFVFDNFTLENNFFNNSTGFGYNDKVEKPFIQNIEITSRSGNNYGATRTGKLTLIIPTKKQFNLIERYFRIGTAFLLEWGWSKYVDKKENNSIDVENIKLIDGIKYYTLKNEIDETTLENAILKQREDNKGNYDGGIFFITNFTTNIQNNATDYYYELTINMVSKGDILNSLEPNTPPVIDPDSESSTSIDDKVKNNPLIKYLDNLEKNIAIANIENLLTGARTSSQRLLTGEGTTQTGTTTSEEIEGTLRTGTIDVPGTFVGSNNTTNDSTLDLLNPNDNFITISISKPLPGGDPYDVYVTAFTDQKFNGGTKEESISYVKLRYILNLLSALVENSSEYVEQDQTYGLPLYYCTLEPSTPNPTFYKWKWEPYNHFASFNPERVVLPHYLLKDILTVSSIQKFLSKEKDIADRFKIGGILIRTKFLIDEISNLIKDNKFSFNNILDLILREINQWTDNELNLIKYDVDGTNKYSVVSLKSTDLIGEILPELKLYGKGSIVEQVDIDTVISNEISSQVAIMMNGSTNYKIDPMATSLLKFNTGIKSRLKRLTPQSNRRNPGGYLGVIETIHRNNHSFLFGNSKTIPPYQDSLDQFRKFKQDYSDAVVENSAYDGIQGTPLFPIKIRTTLPGISGIAIGNKLKIEDVRLPDIYTSNKVYYVVTNQQSKIENRYWQTFLDLSPQINTEGGIKGKSTQDVENPNVVQNPEIPPINIELLLNVIKQIESGRIRFATLGGIEEGPIWFGVASQINSNPLLSTAGNDPHPVKARGPYQLKPDAVYDALESNRNRSIVNNLLTENKPPIQYTTSKYKWRDNLNFNNIIDTISGSRRLAKLYLQRYQTQLQPNERTYLRLLSIYYLGTSAAYNILRNNKGTGFLDQAEKQNKNGSYTKYLTDGRTLLENAGVPAVELNDPFIQANILSTFPVLQ
jgi:hypothetical protein